MTDTPVDSTPPSDSEPEGPSRLVREALNHWKVHLVDTTRRNNLLYYKDLAASTARLDDAPESNLARLVTGDRVTDAELHGAPEFPEDPTDEQKEKVRKRHADAFQNLKKRLREIEGRARLNLEEKGLETLFIAFGLATWDDQGGSGDRRPAAPVLLFPMHIDAKGAGSTRKFTLGVTGEGVVNPVLLHMLDALGVRVTQESLFEGIEGLLDGDPGVGGLDEIDRVLRLLTGHASGIDEFEIESTVVLSNFDYHKQAMVEDLNQALIDGSLVNDLVGGMAGDVDSLVRIQGTFDDPEPREFDHLDTFDRSLVLDADSSQESVIRRALQGQSGVIQGPPGTGKSQTLSNLIAAVTSHGLSTLFVAEKAAALEAVRKRLDAVGLGHLILDLHTPGMSRKAFADQIRIALEGVKSSHPDAHRQIYGEHEKLQQTLVTHHDRMHSPRDPLGSSVYEMRSTLERTPAEHQWEPGWSMQELGEVWGKNDEAIDQIRELAAFEDLFGANSGTPWSALVRAPNSANTRGDDPVEQILRDVRELQSAWDGFRDHLHSLGRDVSDDADLNEIREVARSIGEWRDKYSGLTQAAWDLDIDRLTAAFRPLGGSFSRLWRSFTNTAYRKARETLMEATGRSPARSEAILPRVERIREARREWDALANRSGLTVDAPVDSLYAGAKKATAFEVAWSEARTWFPDLWNDTSSIADLDDDLVDLMGDDLAASRMVLAVQKREVLTRSIPHLNDPITALLAVGAENWERAWRYGLHHAAYQTVRRTDPEVEAFSGDMHENVVRRFQTKDMEVQAANALRVARHHAQWFMKVSDEYPEEYAILRREAEKKTRHKSLRALMEEAPNALAALFPCWMASPLSVSQKLARSSRFDLVLFDEASQIFPWDAVPALMRGRRLVVAGDRNQMPPTSFFASGEEQGGPDDVSEFEGYESLLAQASTFLNDWSLNWHYRSRDERLIAFSNVHIYGSRLVTFPGPGEDGIPMRAEVVEHPKDLPEYRASGPAEVKRCVELVLEHAENRPNVSLGVITAGIEHAKRIEAQLDQELSLRPDLLPFFERDRDERFFVKSIERVQGDERDAIILSFGYAKDVGGNLRHNFGPITHEQGHRRLNVATTRSRRQMTVLSGFSWEDVDLSRSKARGVEYLKGFLRYAQSGGAEVGNEEMTETPMNGWELEVYDALRHAGLDLVAQYGVSGYRIDIVAKHPDKPGRFVLAIECDGASYHSSPIARERDRLRQQFLENLGWRFHRIWSTDWWNNKQREIQRTLDAYRAALTGEGRAAPTADEVQVPEPATQLRGPRPSIQAGKAIVEYENDRLVALAEWIMSDAVLRTTEELVDEMVQELGFSRRGARINRTLSDVAKVVLAT